MTTARDNLSVGNAALDQMLGRGSLGHLALAGAAGVFGPARDDDPEAVPGSCRAVPTTSSPILTRRPLQQRAALVGDIDDHILARQVFRQRAAIDLALAPAGALAARSSVWPSASASLAAIACSTSSSIRASWSGSIFSRPRAEAMALQLLDDGDQALVLGAARREQRLERAASSGSESAGVGMALRRAY